MKWAVLFLACSASIFAVEAKRNSTIEDNKRENYFITSTHTKIAPRVNPITGECIDEETDLAVAGCEALSARRFYSHRIQATALYGVWRLNPETYFTANFEWSGQETYAAVGDRDGSITCYNAVLPCQYGLTQQKAITHFAPSGQNHPLNTKITYWKKIDPKNDERFEWRGTVVDGSGAQRVFFSPMHKWHGKVTEVLKETAFEIWTKRRTPHKWTPYQLKFEEERRPNGTFLEYHYEAKKGEYYPESNDRLVSITAYNADKTKKIGSLNFDYSNGTRVTGSDGRTALVHNTAVTRAGLPKLSYVYENGRLSRIEQPLGVVLTTTYDSANRVSAQYAPIGPKGEMHPIGRYVYKAKSTEVLDAEGHKTLYHFDDNKRLTCIESSDRKG